MSVASYYSQILSPPKAKWSIDSIPDLSGQIIIVTGANTGIGKETARVLLTRNAKVYIACRNREKAQAAIEDLLTLTGKQAYLIEIDLANLKSIKAAVQDFLSRESQLHVLFNNGGVMWTPMDQLTEDGYDLQFGVNCLAPFYLTTLLLPTLIATAATTPTKKVRVINTSSWLHLNAKGLNFETFRDGKVRRKKDGGFLYSQSKYATNVFSNELARRYGGQGIVSISLHPGAIRTELARNIILPPFLTNTMMKIAHPVELGALTQLRAGTAPEAEQWNGKYLIPWARLGEQKAGTEDPVLGKKLWEWMEEQVKDI